MEHEACQLEQRHVHGVYESTASYFNDLESKAWPRVRQFLLDQKPGSLIADIGCGTGKYLSVNCEVYNLGCDYCGPLVEIAKKKGHEVMVCDNLNLPCRDECFDAVISIGVIHHFSTKQRRIRAIKEMVRVLIPGGQVMLYVWAMEQKNRRFEKQDVFVPWNKALCSRPPSETTQSGRKGTLGHSIEMQDPNKQTMGSAESINMNNLRQGLDTKRSHSTDNYAPAEGCCIKFYEDESRFYAVLGRSLRSWFFSRSLDEFALKKQIEKMKPLKSLGGWANSAISAQPSRHCSLDLGHRGSLLQGESFDDDEVFMENTSHKKAQWFLSSDAIGDLNGVIQSNGIGTSFQNDLTEDRICTCKCSDETDKSTVSKILKRTSTTDSADSILDAAVAVEDQDADMLDAKAYMRYYHVFREGELCCLLEENVPDLQILNSCYDHGNWYIIAEKK
ncbi:probable tRNA methyltransferase 9B [Rhinatrema bivittatum]|uniref:probable tRNA methyltransferase 9B n=1 Tax=Rhinatrema bivittatum TaxID=194408 RepID=UPI001126A366|nr:probable tRNA methyltransferase 9B [Rhinatrema bivittatum]